MRNLLLSKIRVRVLNRKGGEIYAPRASYWQAAAFAFVLAALGGLAMGYKYGYDRRPASVPADQAAQSAPAAQD